MGALTLALGIGLLAALASPIGAATDFEIRPIVRVGDATPSGGTFTGFGEVRVSGAAGVLFEALLGDRRGLFLASEGRILPVALQGNPTPLGGRYLQLSYFVINGRQEVAFVATIERGRRDRQRPAAAILRVRGGKAQVLAKVRDPAPGQGVFKEFRDLALDGAGRVAFYASLSDGDRPGGLFVRDGQETRRIVAVLDPAPIGGRFKEVSVPSLGPGGAVAFHATVVDSGIRSGLFTVKGFGAHKIAATRDPSPVGGTFTQFANPQFDHAGRLYFWAEVANGRSGAALFLADSQGIRPLASRGRLSPAGPPFAYLGLNFCVRRAAAFQATLEDEVHNSAIFLANVNGVRVVVRAGDRGPGGGTFSSFGEPAVSESGAVTFVGSGDGADGIYLAVPKWTK